MLRRRVLIAFLLVSSCWFLSSCSGKEPDGQVDEISGKTTASGEDSSQPANNAQDEEPTDTAEPPRSAAEPVIADSVTFPASTPLPTLPPGDRIDDQKARSLMAALIGSEQKTADEALASILRAGDTRFIGVLIELMRARQVSIVDGSYSDYIEALQELSGQAFGQDWPAWVEWYGKTTLQPPPGFTGWKGTLLGRIDPGFSDFLKDEYPARIRVEEIQWGGVRIDGIPPLEQAPTLPGVEAEYLLEQEPVFGIVVNGDARAYPLRIIDNHEMANDVIGGVPVSLSYCTLCGAAIAYDGRGPGDLTFDFGTSGFLYRSNKLMYDRQTNTLWNQLTGEPVLGELADQDVELDIIPVVLTSWGDWLDQHPETLVLDRNTGYYPADLYVPGVFYGDYFASSDTMFPVWQRSDLLPAKEFVYTLHLDGTPKAYQIEALTNDRVVNDTLGQTTLVLVANRGSISVDGRHQYAGPVVYDVGGEVRAFRRGDNYFTAGDDPDKLFDQDGKTWQVTEEGLINAQGDVLPRLSGHLAYWFGWYAFFPETQLYSISSSAGG